LEKSSGEDMLRTSVLASLALVFGGSVFWNDEAKAQNCEDPGWISCGPAVKSAHGTCGVLPPGIFRVH